MGRELSAGVRRSAKVSLCYPVKPIVVRYADDNALGFQYRAEADRFLEDFRERLARFGLELHPDKTRRIEFGRFAQQSRKQRGKGKPFLHHAFKFSDYRYGKAV
jgi:hypothetical protein